jgi:hypothetical protein
MTNSDRIEQIRKRLEWLGSPVHSNPHYREARQDIKYLLEQLDTANHELYQEANNHELTQQQLDIADKALDMCSLALGELDSALRYHTKDGQYIVRSSEYWLDKAKKGER